MGRPFDHIFRGLSALGVSMFIGILKPHCWWRHVPQYGRMTHERKWPWQRRAA